MSTTENTDENRDEAFELLRGVHPLLANVNEKNLAQFMIHASTWARHKELQREDAIIQDHLLEPVSHVLGEALTRCFPGLLEGPEVPCYSVLRTFCFDHALVHRDPSIQQVVIVGCPLDTRAFRVNSLKDCTFFEMQLNQDVMDYKEHVLAEVQARPVVAKRTAFSTNFSDDGWQQDLLDGGFDPAKPTFWILESTMQFIKPESVEPLLRGIDALSTPHSQMVTERVMGGGLGLDLDDDKEFSFLVHTNLRYGEDAGVFRNLRWDADLLMRRNQACEYYGSLWDPVRFDRLRVEGEDAAMGPWFLVLFSKPE